MNWRRFFIREGRLHPAWRVALYLVAYPLSMMAANAAVVIVYLKVIHGSLAELTLQPMGALPLGLKLGSILVTLATTLLVTYLFRRFLDGRSFRSLGFQRRPGWLGEIAFGLALGFVLMGGIFLVEWGCGWLTFEGFAWRSEPLGGVLLSLLAHVAFFAPAAVEEEVAFRGYVLQNLREGWGIVPAVLLSSAIFGLFHSLNPHASPLALADIALAGIVFSCAYLATGSLWLPMAFHFAWNFFQGPVFGFPVSGLAVEGLLATRVGASIVTGGPFGPEGGLAGIGANLAGLALLWLWVRRSAGN